MGWRCYDCDVMEGFETRNRFWFSHFSIEHDGACNIGSYQIEEELQGRYHLKQLSSHLQKEKSFIDFTQEKVHRKAWEWL